LAKELAKIANPKIKVKIKVFDGKKVKKGREVLVFEGSVKSILTFERTCLNFMGRLSGIATFTSQFAAKIKKHGVFILDTRKTTPNLRLLEKYAVVCGGGVNHRFGLFDAVLIKDNHVWGWNKTNGEKVDIRRNNFTNSFKFREHLRHDFFHEKIKI